MHEYPATKRIVEIACQKAAELGAPRVDRIDVVMGDSCGYLAESIELYFEIIAEGTPCENARLAFRHITPLFGCQSCGKTYERQGFGFECPYCGQLGRPTDTGREFYIESITIDTNEETI